MHTSGTNEGKSQDGEGIAPEIVDIPNTTEGCAFSSFDDLKNKFEKVLEMKFHISAFEVLVFNFCNELLSLNTDLYLGSGKELSVSKQRFPLFSY